VTKTTFTRAEQLFNVALCLVVDHNFSFWPYAW